MDMEKMIKAFDMLIADSEKRGISIYENPGIDHFIIQCKDELQSPDAYDILKDHIQKNADIYLAHMNDDSSEMLTIDTAILKLKFFIYKTHGIDALNRIQVINKN